MPVITGYLVRVFVGQISWPYELTINHDEVESVFTIPLNWLAEPAHRMNPIQELCRTRNPGDLL